MLWMQQMLPPRRPRTVLFRPLDDAKKTNISHEQAAPTGRGNAQQLNAGNPLRFQLASQISPMHSELRWPDLCMCHGMPVEVCSRRVNAHAPGSIACGVSGALIADASASVFRDAEVVGIGACHSLRMPAQQQAGRQQQAVQLAPFAAAEFDQRDQAEAELVLERVVEVCALLLVPLCTLLLVGPIFPIMFLPTEPALNHS